MQAILYWRHTVTTNQCLLLEVMILMMHVVVIVVVLALLSFQKMLLVCQSCSTTEQVGIPLSRTSRDPSAESFEEVVKDQLKCHNNANMIESTIQPDEEATNASLAAHDVLRNVSSGPLFSLPSAYQTQKCVAGLTTDAGHDTGHDCGYQWDCEFRCVVH